MPRRKALSQREYVPHPAPVHAPCTIRPRPASLCTDLNANLTFGYVAPAPAICDSAPTGDVLRSSA